MTDGEREAEMNSDWLLKVGDPNNATRLLFFKVNIKYVLIFKRYISLYYQTMTPCRRCLPNMRISLSMAT